MSDMMTAIPPMHQGIMTSGDAAYWVLIGLLAVLLLAATVLWIVGNQHIARRQSQVKEAGYQYETLLPPRNDEQPQRHSRQEEITLRR